MNPENPDVPTGHTPSGCFSLFGLWVAMWLLIAAAGIGWYVHHLPQTIVDDWPNVRSSEADHWHGGKFLGHSADRIRRVATYRGDQVQQHSIHFFATIPMAQREFELEVGRWRELGWFRDATVGPSILPEVENCPDWFPFSSEYHVGTVSEFGVPPSYHLFRLPGDDHVHLWK
jgi:hypothetical protein